MDLLETRELCYFVAVADELHFGRAADRLGIAQPPLSRAIKRLERRLGVRLLHRSSRLVSLTPAGEMLLHEARRALDAVAAAARRTQRADSTEPTLVLVTKPGGDAGLLPDILRAYEADPDAVATDVVVCGVGEQATLLRDGRADAGFLHHPYDDLSGFDTEELRTEAQVAVLPESHRLAGWTSLRMSDLAGEPMPRWPGMAPDSGEVEVHDTGQLLQLVALGRVVAVLPESVRGQLRRDLVTVPVVDAAPTTVVLAWPERSHSRAVAAFVRAAASVAPAAAPRDDHETPAEPCREYA